MYNTRFNSNFQNMMPNQVANFDPYADMNGDGGMGGVSNAMQPQMQQMQPQFDSQTQPMTQPQQMPSQGMESSMYPYESQTPYGNQPPQGYAAGGSIQTGNRRRNYLQEALAQSQMNNQNQNMGAVAQMLAQQGRGGDTMLAHINPQEAQMLQEAGGSGTINPVTGLPEFRGGIFSKNYWTKKGPGGFRGHISNALSYGPVAAIGIQHGLSKRNKKAVTAFGQKYVLPVAGAVAGNMILPGIGGTIGGSLGGTAGAGLRGSSLGEGAIRGGTIGALLPSAASMAGAGANALGFDAVGQGLSQYGTQNALLPSIGKLFGGSGVASEGGNLGVSAGDGGGGTQQISPTGGELMNSNVSPGTTPEDKGFFASLGSKSKDFFTDPKNLLTLAATTAAFTGREKPKSPEEEAALEKRKLKALRMTPEELKEKEAYDLASEQAAMRIRRDKFRSENNILGSVAPRFRKTHTPGEYAQNGGNWFSYYDNPGFQGAPIPFKEGGSVYEGNMAHGGGVARYFQGDTGGQADKVNIMASDGEFMMPADVVAKLGDGNNMAGANELYEFIENVRKRSNSNGTKLPPKAKSVQSYFSKK